MRKVIAISAIVFTFVAVLFVQWYVVQAGEDRGQQIIDRYLDRANHSPEKVKFHLALMRTTRQWNDRQLEVIDRGIHDRTSVSEADVAANFSHEDAGAVFYNPGTFDIEDLRRVYSMSVGKAELVHSWPIERQHKVWQMNAALTLVRYPDLTPDQQQYVVEFAQAIPTIDRESAKQWDRRAVDLGFARQVGRTLLTTIGDGRCPGMFASLGKPKTLPTCGCTTHAGNWSCNDTCHGEGTCSVDPGNCGILWLYDCNGMCNSGDLEG